MHYCLPRPGPGQRDLGRIDHVVALERHGRGGGPGRARLELRVGDLDLQVLVRGGEGGGQGAPGLQLALVAQLDGAELAVLRLVVNLRRYLVLAEGSHQLHARGLGLDQEGGLQVNVAVANGDRPGGRHLLQVVDRVELGGDGRAADVGGQLDLGGLVTTEVLRHLVAQAQVVAIALDQAAAQSGRLEAALVPVVVVRAVELRLEVADVERLAPGRLQVVEGRARPQVGGGDLSRAGHGTDDHAVHRKGRARRQRHDNRTITE
eukprot:scaffold113285_cov63-Phaeocystis_antarctica.AAC.1